MGIVSKKRFSIANTSIRDRIHLFLVLVMMGAAVCTQLDLQNWLIEDAAISFSYARNLATGEGLVPYPGAERVEGYSNPTWVVLLALFELFGIEGFISSKILGGIFGALTVPFVYLITREGRERLDEVPLLASALLVVNSQFNIWNASGLENSLFCFLMAVACWRTLIDIRTARTPWSALLFFLLAASRPEAIIYAAFGGIFFALHTLNSKGGFRLIAKWLAIFFIPFIGYHGIRYLYFAWPFPNTYYAKLGDMNPKPFKYEGRGWKYLRRYASGVGNNKEPGLYVGYFLPLVLLALSGVKGRRLWMGAILSVLLCALFLFPGPEDFKEYLLFEFDPGATLETMGVISDGSLWVNMRASALGIAAVIFGCLAAGRREGRAPLLSLGMLVISLFFAIWANGDWMKGYRWLSMSAVPFSVLLALGTGNLADLLGTVTAKWSKRSWGIQGWVVAFAIIGLFAHTNQEHAAWFSKKRETGPYSVRKRVNYLNNARRRMHIESITGMDVDMGAHLWWSGWEMVDMAGLIDVPIGHHNYQKPFMREYIHEERQPEFAHVHGGWANKTKIPQHPEWRRNYFEIPGYPVGKTALHIGSHIRRDLIMKEEWDGHDEHSARFDRILLHGIKLPFNTAVKGRHLYLEAGLSVERFKKNEGFRVVAFLSNGAKITQSWDLAPGFDWLLPEEWRDDEIFHGSWSMPIKRSTGVGSYDLGFVVFGPDGQVIPLDEESPDSPPIFATGELIIPAAVEIIENNQTEEKEASQLVDDARALADAGSCGEAERTWLKARQRMTRRFEWQNKKRPAVNAAISDCLANQAAEAETLEEKVTRLASAKKFDHRRQRLAEVRAPVVAELEASGKADAVKAKAINEALRTEQCAVAGYTFEALTEALIACEEGDTKLLTALEEQTWDSSYFALRDVMRIDPSRSFTRKLAEEVRDYRLNLDPHSMARKARERAERKTRAEERKAERNQKKREKALEKQKKGEEISPDEVPWPSVEDAPEVVDEAEGGMK